MLLAFLSLFLSPQLDTSSLNVLFIGDRGHHQPVARLNDVYGKLIRAGISVDYEDNLEVLDLAVLRQYDTIVMYANQSQHATVPLDFMRAITRYVRGGGGFVGLHCTSGCFTKSDSWLKFIGARFESHASEVFTQTVISDHELVAGWSNFTAWDETYVQTHVEDDRTILTMRGDEPWSWIRQVGKGRLFYSASGHDARVWTTDGFFDMLLRAIIYTAADGAQLREYPQFEYDANEWVPNYEGRDPQDLLQRVSTPQQAVDSLVVPAGMHAELFACEPMIVNPIAMAWDERGRCWVIETPGYPATRDGGDSICILEDTDGDGRADKKTVFATGLNLPTSLLKVDGGLLVTQAPDLLFLRDDDDDDVCDGQQVLLNGFGVFDTHAGPANLRWGPDNYIWGTVGYSSYKSEVGSFGSGLWRWKPGLEHPEFMAQFSNNTWGIDFNSKGEVWGSTANNAPSFFVGMPSVARALPVADSAQVHPALSKIRQGDFFGNFTAAAGHSLATGEQLPAWWNETSAFICEPTAHLISRQEIYPSGSGYRTRDCFNVVASVDDWFCPVQVDVGPDGALWVADFSQFIILHNLPGEPERGLPKIDFDKGNAHINPLRDQSHGRIFRIVRDGAPPQSEFDLSSASADEILLALYSTNKFWRVTARRLLVEQEMHGATGVLHSLVRKFLEKGPHAKFAALEALRVLSGLDAYNDPSGAGIDTINELLVFQSSWLGEVGLDVMPRNAAFSKLLARSNLIITEDKNRQRHALLAAAEMPPSYAIAQDLLAAALDIDYRDVWLLESLKLAIKAHGQQFAELADKVAVDEEQLAGAVQKLPSAKYFTRSYSGKGDFSRNGEVLIIDSAEGADCSYSIIADVLPNMNYSYSGWIKTENLERSGKTLGAVLNIHPQYIISEYVRDTSDWTEVSVVFTTAPNQKTIELNCLYGGWGQATGKAYFKDLTLTALSTANNLSTFLKMAQEQPPQSLSGDVQRGADVFVNNAANCLSCHPGVGPDLSGIGERLTSAQIKEGIIDPTATRAAGWEDNPAIMSEVVNFLSAQDIADLVAYLESI